MRQILLLLKLDAYNLCGWNTFRHTKDPKARRRWLLLCVTWVVLVLMMAGYMLLTAVGIVQLGLAPLLPAVLYTAAAPIIFFFDTLKAGGTIFSASDYDRLVPLPVCRAAIVVSRFLSMYLQDLALSLVVLLPGLGVYAVTQRPGPVFYLFGLLGAVLLPMLPLTAACVIGAGVTAISARFRHKSLVSTLLMVLAMLVLLVGSFVVSFRAEAMSGAALLDLFAVLSQKIAGGYPPALWFAQSVTQGSVPALLLLLAASLLPMTLCLFVVQRYYSHICSALHTGAHGHYTMRRQSSAKPLQALYGRELRRYFASAIYVTNTCLDGIMCALLGIALLVVGADKLETLLELPGILNTALPLVLGATLALMPTTASAISMEGAQWWLVRTLPVRGRDLFGAKVLVNLSVNGPGYLVGVVCACLALRPGLPGLLTIVFVPLAYLVFSSFSGLAANLALPLLEWSRDTQVVKQSSAGLVSLLITFAAVALPGVALVFLPGAVVYPATFVLLLLGSAALFAHCNRVDLRKIG